MIDNEQSINDLSCCVNSFGYYLRYLRKESKITIRELAKKVNKTPTYISDIEKGNNKPPNKELLELIIQSLNISNQKDKINKLYNLAAKERNDIPVDIKNYITANPNLIELIRIIKDTPDKQDVWKELLKNLKDNKNI